MKNVTVDGTISLLITTKKEVEFVELDYQKDRTIFGVMLDIGMVLGNEIRKIRI